MYLLYRPLFKQATLLDFDAWLFNDIYNNIECRAISASGLLNHFVSCGKILKSGKLCLIYDNFKSGAHWSRIATHLVLLLVGATNLKRRSLLGLFEKIASTRATRWVTIWNHFPIQKDECCYKLHHNLHILRQTQEPLAATGTFLLLLFTKIK